MYLYYIYHFLFHVAYCLFLVSFLCLLYFTFFFFNDTATTEIYTLSLHDALPIFAPRGRDRAVYQRGVRLRAAVGRLQHRDRKSTRLNSSHTVISYAVFCLKKKKNKKTKKNQKTNSERKQTNKRAYRVKKLKQHIR